ncbi:unnamed protein product [Gulo gulo]|uniref:Uncharacterized protein n=1 Tax=Gulo gulo TaxID=48420 RepID=A0A9X9Q727_GULGU|nr:unnamed protein product [Gulo gulo]
MLGPSVGSVPGAPGLASRLLGLLTLTEDTRISSPLRSADGGRWGPREPLGTSLSLPPLPHLTVAIPRLLQRGLLRSRAGLSSSSFPRRFALRPHPQLVG